MSIADRDRAGVKAAIQIIAEVQKHYPRMEISQLAVLLRILEKPGTKATDLLIQTGLSKGAMSRAIRILGSGSYVDDGSGSEKPGLNLITQVTDPFDGRAKLIAPTRLGKLLGDQIDKIVGEANGTTARETLAS